MKKNKQRLLLLFLTLLANVFVVSDVLAGASATLTWTPPTTDEGNQPLTGLTGYKIYYHTSSLWASATGTCSQGVGSVINVSGGTTNKYIFLNNLTPGTTYYFTIAATDGINLSSCGTDTGGATQVSKRLTYSGDFNSSQSVNIFDYNILKGAFGTPTGATSGDADRDADVDIFDYNILKADYGLSFT